MAGIKEIAEAVGLSRHTVSDVLNCGDKRYSEATRKKIQEAAERMGYRPNRVAQSLRRKRTTTIGIINFHSLHELSEMKLQKVLDEVKKTGYYPEVSNGQWHLDGCRETVGQMIEARVSGVLLINPSFGHADEFAELGNLLKHKIPVVALGGDKLVDVPRFLSDKEHGFYSMTRHLVEEGYRRVLLMLKGYETEARVHGSWHQGYAMRGYRKCLQEYGLEKEEDIVFVQADPNAPDSGYRNDPYIMGYTGMKRALQRPMPTPDAVMASNDSWAYGALRACKEAGIQVPRDMALCGFEDELSSRYGLLSLTTFRHPLDALARGAVRHLMELIRKGEPGEPGLHVIPGELVIRESSQPAEEVIFLGEEALVMQPTKPI